jgi:hypothetical protein
MATLEGLARQHARELAKLGINPARAKQIAAENCAGYPAAIQRAYLKAWRAAYQVARKSAKA